MAGQVERDGAHELRELLAGACAGSVRAAGRLLSLVEGERRDELQSIALARLLAPLGVDLFDCSSGGLVAGARIPYIAAFTMLLGLGAAALVRFSGYRYARYLAFIDMDNHRQDLAYQPFQSLMGFGSAPLGELYGAIDEDVAPAWQSAAG